MSGRGKEGDKRMDADNNISLNYKPLYVQVKDRLLNMIERKELRFGERLPSEPDLAKMFGVSRSTVREAIRVMAQEGEVIVRHGLGTFVAGSRVYVRSDLGALRSITWAIKQRGWTPGTTCAQMHEDVADSELAEKLQIPESAPVICIKRIRTADSHPVFYSIHKLSK
ncbi:MAG: GntR family transcriptional regulator, partial [Firmicutes bacterium]|nr:GntR family transcriptional regulator [Bacillota bacterium]